MIRYFNIVFQSDRFNVVNIHKLMNSAASFTLPLSTLFNFFFKSCPSISIFFLTVSTPPIRIVFSMRAIFCPPSRRANMRAKIMFNSFSKIGSRTLKFFLAPFTFFCSSISWACASGWTDIVAFTRAILPFIAYKACNFFVANNALKRSFPFVIFPSGYLFAFFIEPAHSHIITYLVEIDAEYHEKAVKRLEEHKRQERLFVGCSPAEIEHGIKL